MKSNFLAILGISIILTTYSGSLLGQKAIKARNFPDKLPKIELIEKTPQKYLLVINGCNYDIYGNFHGKSRVSGEYTRGLKNDSVKWDNVRLAQSQDLNESFSEREIQENMENFSYVVSEEIDNGNFFKITPETNVQIKTLFWDIFTFEVFAWDFWDSLKLNMEYSSTKINSVVKIEGLGTIENTDMRICWTGITKKNGKTCAILKFTAMNNPLEFNLPNTDIKGSTHYWGNVYVSLTDKHIEYGELHEILFMEIIINGQTTGNKAYSTRDLTLEKIL